MDKPLVGPALPPGFDLGNKEYTTNQASDKQKEPNQHTAFAGPALPPGFTIDRSNVPKPSPNKTVNQTLIGCSVPPTSRKSSSSSEDSSSDSSDSESGSDSNSESDSSSPRETPDSSDTGQRKTSHVVAGPALPPRFAQDRLLEDPEDEDDSGTVGPMPCTGPGITLSAAEEFDRRAKRMKDKLLNIDTEGDGPIKRESWMTELPADQGVSFGLGPRKFRKNARPDEDEDRSVWTDTPADRERKEKEGGSGQGKKRSREEAFLADRDQQLSRQVEDYTKCKRPDSLLEMHQKKLRKKEKKEEKKRKKDKKKGKVPQEPARRPFDRDQDLQVGRFDDAQKKAFIKRSAGIASRFGHGNQQFI